jgi:linoleate 10R-lipoxygenase
VISRTLPNQFPQNSIYLWFPLMTPEAMKTNFTRIGIAGDYDFSKPIAAPEVQHVRHRRAVTSAMKDTSCIHTPYGQKILSMVGKEPGYVLFA